MNRINKHVNTRIIHSQNSQRIAWIDISKSIAIFFVFYYHILHFVIYKDYPHGLIESRFILSFIMPLFFFLSGLVFNDRLLSLKKYFLKSYKSLIAPLYFFNFISLILLICVRLFYQGPLVTEEQGAIIVRILALLIAGLPSFSGPTWFLTCLSSVQVLHFFVTYFSKSNVALILSLVLFSVVSIKIVPLFNYPGYIVKGLKFFWFFPSALSAIVFFQAGILFRRIAIENILKNKLILLIILFLSGVVVITTFNLNTSAYSGYWQGAYLNFLNYGNYFLFYIPGFSGAIFFICLSMLIKPYKILLFYGENTLILLGLNGIFYHFLNPLTGQFFINYCKNINWWSFFLLCICITIIQFGLCYPFIGIIKKSLTIFVNRLTFW